MNTLLILIGSMAAGVFIAHQVFKYVNKPKQGNKKEREPGAPKAALTPPVVKKEAGTPKIKTNIEQEEVKSAPAAPAVSTFTYRNPPPAIHQEDNTVLAEVIKKPLTAVNGVKKNLSVRFKSSSRSAKVRGAEGEHRVKQILEKFNPGHYLCFHDVMVRKNSGHTSQIDHVILSNYAIIAIETKRWYGKISGKETGNRWLQTNGERKRRYYNPVLQNEGHLKALSQVFSAVISHNPELPLVSMIVFVDTKEVEVKVTKPHTHVLFLNELRDTIESYQKPYLSSDQLKFMERQLLDANITDAAERDNHVVRKKKIGKKKNKIKSLSLPLVQKSEEPVDEVYGDVLEFLKSIDDVSVSLIQRKFRIGYTRSARIIDHLEKVGRITPYQGNTPRRVIKTKTE